MFSIKKVLFPTDFSACANHALDQAILWARAHGAELHTLHVLHRADDATLPVLQEQATATINEQLELAGAQHLIVHNTIHSGEDITGDIVETIRDEEIDLVIMGTHGRTGVAAVLNKSVSEEVVRVAPCPVLVVPENDVTWPPKRILTPLDFSALSMMAAQYGKALAAHHDGSLLMLHIVENAMVPDFYPGMPPTSYPPQPEVLEASGRQLERMFDEIGGTPVPRETHAMAGRASIDIVGFANANDVDLIVMPTHGLSGVSRWFLGSVTERVVRRAPCPVLTLRPFGRQLIDDVIIGEPAEVFEEAG